MDVPAMLWDVWIRAALSVIPVIGQWTRKTRKPEPVATVFVRKGHVYLEIQNRGATADFTAQIIKAVNVDQWPLKTVWARWDHDKDANVVRIPRRARAWVRVASIADRRGLTWTCFWGSDYVRGQVRVARPTGLDWTAQLHVQIVTDPPCDGGLEVHVFLKADGGVSCLVTATKFGETKLPVPSKAVTSGASPEAV